MKINALVAASVMVATTLAAGGPGVTEGLFVGTDLEGKTCTMEVAGDDGFWAKVNYTGNEEYPLYYKGKTGHGGADAYVVESTAGVSSYSLQVDVAYDGYPLDFTFILDGKRNRCFFSE